MCIIYIYIHIYSITLLIFVSGLSPAGRRQSSSDLRLLARIFLERSSVLRDVAMLGVQSVEQPVRSSMSWIHLWFWMRGQELLNREVQHPAWLA